MQQYSSHNVTGTLYVHERQRKTCGPMAEWLGHWTCDQQVAGANPGTPLSSATLDRLFTYKCLRHQAVCWEGNRRSGVALAMLHKQQWYFHLRAHDLGKAMSIPPMHAPLKYSSFYLHLY